MNYDNSYAEEEYPLDEKYNIAPDGDDDDYDDEEDQEENGSDYDDDNYDDESDGDGEMYEENEDNVEDIDDLHEIQVDDDIHEPDPDPAPKQKPGEEVISQPIFGRK